MSYAEVNIELRPIVHVNRLQVFTDQRTRIKEMNMYIYLITISIIL